MAESITSGDIVYIKSDAPSNFNKALYMTVGLLLQDQNANCYYITKTSDGQSKVIKEILPLYILQKAK